MKTKTKKTSSRIKKSVRCTKTVHHYAWSGHPTEVPMKFTCDCGKETYRLTKGKEVEEIVEAFIDAMFGRR